MFAGMLRAESGLEVVLWDERRSSVEAHNTLRANGKREIKHKKTVDAVAAALILQGYLGTMRR
jgi:putative Holliday junction resolvase